jgi:hypothetical protein
MWDGWSEAIPIDAPLAGLVGVGCAPPILRLAGKARAEDFQGERVKNLFHVKRGWSTTLSFERRRGFSIVIASDKREAFAQGSDSDEAVHASASCGMEWIASLRSQ